MIDQKIAIKMYNEGKTFQEIGKYFNVSRQRIWQIVKKDYFLIENHHKKRAYKTINNNPSELYIIGKLIKLGFRVEPQTYNTYFDLLVNGKKVDVKYRNKTRKVKASNSNFYFSFSNLISPLPIDFFIFVCGSLKRSKSFIVPANKVKNTFNIAISYKYAPQELIYERYYENWDSLR